MVDYALIPPTTNASVTNTHIKNNLLSATTEHKIVNWWLRVQ